MAPRAIKKKKIAAGFRKAHMRAFWRSQRRYLRYKRNATKTVHEAMLHIAITIAS